MSINNMNASNREHTEEINELRSKLSSLYGYIMAFRLEATREQRKTEAYLRMITKQTSDIRKALDFLSSYISAGIARDLEEDPDHLED